MRYEVYGQGIPIVFLHGWGGNAHSMMAIARPFFATNRVILVDFEHSLVPTIPLNLDYYVGGVLDILNELKVVDAYFVCHSFGGRVGVRLSSNYPHLTRGLVLIDSAGLKPRRGIKYHFRVFLHKILKKLRGYGLSGSADYRALSPTQKATFVSVVNDFTDRDLKNNYTPTLILWGAKDRDTPLYMARRYKRKLKNSTLKVFKDAGHYSYLERRVETISAIKTYIGDNE
ncbi:MAG: alpha/beta hydrolase [Clostridia bacterium]|nr:alpha/beta hydrolase [Clostridia bacterium]